MPAPGIPEYVQCPQCGHVNSGRALDCSICGYRFPPQYPSGLPGPLFCYACGTRLEWTSRYRRGYCPACAAYR